jgi:adenosyl cobinamide kinase/adenosyl cobinamide phosphate guanylyltransferase
MKNKKINRILQLIKNDIAQENHLFKTLSTTDNPFPLLKPLKEAGYFDPEKNPGPIEVENQKGYFTIPHWNVLNYLENVAEKNKTETSPEISNLLADIINRIINYKTEKSERIDNYRTDWIITKIIFLLPLENIQEQHVEFLRTVLHSKWETSLISSEIGKSIIPAILEKGSKKLLLQILEIVFDYKELNKNSTDRYVSLVESYWLKEALQQHNDSIFKLCGKEASDIVIDKIQKIIEKDKTQFNNIWVPTIEDHSQTSFPDRYECQIVYFVRDCYQTLSPGDISEKVKWLFSQEHPIFQRLALHTINYHFEDLSFLFWNWKENPLEVLSIKHELYELLKNNCKSFDSEQIDKVINWIEKKEYYISEEYKDDIKVSEKIYAYRKKEWLSSLLEINNDRINSLYYKYNSINPAELDHPGFDSWSESGWGSESPIEEAELLSKSADEIVEYLNNFKEKGGWKGPSVEGLTGVLKKCVSGNPEKFTVNISTYLKLKRVYQQALLWGFSEAWRSERVIDWHALFLYINGILNSVNFWNESYPENGYNYRNWIISQIADLINDGTRNDQHAFDPTFLPEAEKILFILVEKAESNYYEIHDIVTSVLNSNRGKIFTAMINYSLRNARINKKDEEFKWIESIKTEFTARLDKNIESSLDFSVVIGEYLPNLYYLDKEWVISNINSLFPIEMPKYWEASFAGYLFYASTVYSYLYNLLSKNGHYKKALSIEFKDDHVRDRVAQHVCVAYLEGWEKFEDADSLINLLINSNNVKHLSAVISFFWMQRKNTTEKVKNRIKPLWEQLFNRIAAKEENEEYQKLISDTSKLLSLVEKIDDDIFKWLKLSAKYINKNFNSPFFIEYLLKHVNESPKKVAELFLEILNSGFFPDYKKENILEIIGKISNGESKDTAIRICNLYLNKGFEFTRPIIKEIKKTE